MRPISAVAYPMTYSSQIPELIGLGECMCVSRHCITDIIFVFPLQEVESGFISIAGANPTYFQQFAIHNNTLIPCPATVYFPRYLVEPLSVRLFQSLNLLSMNIKKTMYHGRTSALSTRSFRLPFPMESFLFLHFKLSSAIKDYLQRKEKTIIYYNTLEFEARTMIVHKNFI
jgi:hypothetical protein